MTDPAAIPESESPAPATQRQTSFWEDLIDIFFEPAAVFRRRANGSFWPALAVVAVLLAIFTVANANVLQPIMEGEMQRQMAQMTKSNPNVTPEMIARGRAIGEKIQEFIRYGTIITVPVMAFVYGLWLWAGGWLFGIKQTFNTTMVIVAYSFLPRVIESILFAVQGLLMDPSNLNALSRIQLSAARFFDPDAANPMLLALLSRVDLFVIWFWTLIAIGMYAAGKASRGKAVAFAVTMWLIGTLPGLRNAYMRM